MKRGLIVLGEQEMARSPETSFELSLPAQEAEVLRSEYNQANVILEYGSGGSTVMAAGMQGKRVFSVESDRDWALRLQTHIDTNDFPSATTVYHTDIGPTGNWGRPIDNTYWSEFYKYPLAIWAEPFFRHPDVVLIDGRFRTACMMTVMAKITRPVTVLFDDYRDRRPYHSVEKLIEPRVILGRLAVFDVPAGLISSSDTTMINEALSQVTYGSQPSHYTHETGEAIALRRKAEKERRNEPNSKDA